MRRALLTTASPPAPISIGNPAVTGTSFFNSTLRGAIDLTTPASGSGTITTVGINVEVAGTVYVIIGAVSGSSFTVRSISGALTASVGANTFPVSLSALAGDFVGYISPSSGGAQVRFTGSGGSCQRITPSSPPSPSDVLTMTTVFSNLLSLGGAS